MSDFDLGPLPGGQFHQYANKAGQVNYFDNVTNTRTYSIPAGFEDNPGDTWVFDPSKGWPQWNNARTGRSILIDPNPPPPQTYLDLPNVKASLDLLTRVPTSPEHVFRRPIGGILRFIFPEIEGYEVVQETESEVTRPDFCVFKVSRRPGGTFYQYDFLLTESKRKGEAWGPAEDHLREHLLGNGNETKNCYGMLQVGFEVQFYKFENHVFREIGGRLHLVQDVQRVINHGNYLKQHPMPFI